MAQNVDDSKEKLMEDGNKTFRIYLGNLNPKVDEGTLRGLFEERGISVCSILVKGKFAFADCSEEEIVERAIIELHGFELMGSRMQVEPSTSRRRKSNKIQVKNLHLPKDELENFIASFHFPNVDKIEQAGAEGVVYVTFGNPEDAQLALARINDFDLNGNTLKADFANNRTKRAPREMPHQNGVSNNQQRPASASSLPLRVLVGSEFIGAIIGKEGQTISQITSSTNTKIDIHRKEGMNRRDAMMSSEPVTPITISGTPENASAALKEMMQIVHAEAKNKGYNKIDYPIKLICPNNICGRIIGKQGNVIKKFMEETQTHIVVSKAEDMMIDRIVTISGPLENACKAESFLSEKMRKCQEQDNQHYMNMTMYSGMPPRRQGMMPGPPGPPFMGYHSAMIPPYPPYMHEGFYSGMYGMPQLQGQPTETINLYIPGNVVGSIIGSKGANAKELHQKTGAKIKIERDSGERSHDSERKCAITGTSANRGYALIEIFDKIRKEGGFAKIEDVTLRAEFQVPKEMIGRIIGKKGQNVRELQKVNSCVVKLPDLQDQNASDEEVAVSVTGDLYAILAAQRRILQICEDARRPKIKMVH